MKETYNPFKMWGSYVGFFIFTIVRLVPSPYEVVWNPLRIVGNCSSSVEIMVYWVVGLVWAIIGFLIGFGIHSLVRYFRR